MNRLLASFMLFLLAFPCAGWELDVADFATPGLKVKGMKIGYQPDRIELTVKRLHIEDWNLEQDNVNWQCRLDRSDRNRTDCAGNLSISNPKWLGKMNWQQEENRHSLSLVNAATNIQFATTLDSLPEGDLKLTRVPLVWFQPFIRDAWPGLASLSGELDATFHIDQGGNHIQGSTRLHKLNFDSSDGSIAAAGVDINGNFEMRTLARAKSMEWQASSEAGEILAGPVYFALPASDNRLTIKAVFDPEQSWQLPQLSWRDGDSLHAQMALKFTENSHYHLEVKNLEANIEPTAERYFKTALAALGFDGIHLSGQMQGAGTFGDGGWQAFTLQLQNFDVQDPQDRITVNQLDANLNMAASQPVNSIVWSGMRIYRIPFGAGRAEWTWSADNLQLVKELNLDVLGGQLLLSQLQRIEPDEGDAMWQGGVELRNIDVRKLVEVLDWPSFSGSMSGKVTQFRYENGGLVFDGDLELKVFDGKMRISNLSSERIFGVAPSLGADIEFDNLDLKQLSSAFSFGEMEGWLDGQISELRLLDWSPVAFNTIMKTDNAYPGKKRISQRAVQGLSSVSGNSAAMTGGPMMKLIDSFPYAEIGLRCRLNENVCEMGGLEASGQSYTILKGSGIPRLTIIGHQRRVDWPLLVSRLRAAASGQAPVIE